MIAHQAGRLIVDLDAIIANYRELARRAAPAQAAAALKADAYGIGLAPVAQALHRAGCRTFFVALIEEGMALRRLLPAAEIFVLHGLAGLDRDGRRALIAENLRPVLNSLTDIEAWRESGGKGGALHVDTGMARLGLSAAEAEILIAQPALIAGLEIDLVMSHLACGDLLHHPQNEEQLAAFRRFLDASPWAKTSRPRLSLAASGGIFLGADYAFDLVRPGIALYGAAPLSDRPNPLRPALSLQAKILQTREIDFDTPVGYGATHRARRATRLATIGAGYADGLLRSLGNRGVFYLENRPLPIVGRVSMDLITLDIGELPPDRGRIGDWVEIIGKAQSLDDLAAAAGTNAYEILTRLGPRWERHYIGGQGTP